MSTTTIKKENLTIHSFFDREEQELFSEIIQHAIDEKIGDTQSMVHARAWMSALPFDPKSDFELWAVINHHTSEGIFSSINDLWKKTGSPEKQAALQDMAWKIQDYVY